MCGFGGLGRGVIMSDLKGWDGENLSSDCSMAQLCHSMLLHIQSNAK